MNTNPPSPEENYYETEEDYLYDHFCEEAQMERRIQDYLDEEAHLNFLNYLETIKDEGDFL